jgi:hypothetical protein
MKILHMAFSKAIFSIVIIWSTLASAVDQLKIPVWKLERDGKTSYAIGTIPVQIKAERIPPAIRGLVKSKNTFISDVDEVDVTRRKGMRAAMVRAFRGEDLRQDLGSTSAEWMFIDQTMLEVGLKLVGTLKMMFVPVTPSLKVLAMAGAARRIAPTSLASILIAAQTDNIVKGKDNLGLGLRLLTIAQSEHRSIQKIENHQRELASDSISTDQFRSFIQYLMSKKNEQIDPYGTWHTFMLGMDPITTGKLAEQKMRDHDEWLEKLKIYHETGGAVISVDISDLADGPGGSFLKRLDEDGFHIMGVNLDEPIPSCQNLLEATST